MLISLDRVVQLFNYFWRECRWVGLLVGADYINLLSSTINLDEGEV